MAPSSNKLVRVLYRGLLRAGARLDAAAALGSMPSAAASPSGLIALFTLPGGLPQGAYTFRDVVRHQFKSSPNAISASPASVDAGLRALASANKLVATLANQVAGSAGAAGPAAATELAHSGLVTGAASPPSAFAVGQVFHHRLFGYRAVIIACDTSCRASDQWVQSTGARSLPHGTAQPFYHCLVDIRDRPAAQVSYVAQDNVQLLEPVDAAEADVERLVLHPLLTRYFDKYRVDAGCYVPGRRLLDAAVVSATADGGAEPASSPRVSTVAA